jgi:hypothetical protein
MKKEELMKLVYDYLNDNIHDMGVIAMSDSEIFGHIRFHFRDEFRDHVTEMEEFLEEISAEVVNYKLKFESEIFVMIASRVFVMERGKE